MCRRVDADKQENGVDRPPDSNAAEREQFDNRNFDVTGVEAIDTAEAEKYAEEQSAHKVVAAVQLALVRLSESNAKRKALNDIKFENEIV